MKRIYCCSCGFALRAKPQEQQIFFLDSEGQFIFRIAAAAIRNMKRIFPNFELLLLQQKKTKTYL